MAENIAVQMKNITKKFGSVVANSNVDLTVYKGEILSLLGENGSGKTTLMNMLSGIYYPDEGEIYINGEKVIIKSPKDAYNNKIGMIHQHFKLVDLFSAKDNIILGEEMPRYSVSEEYKKLKGSVEKNKLFGEAAKLPFIKLGKEIKFNWLSGKSGNRAEEVAEKYGFEINLNRKITDGRNYKSIVPRRRNIDFGRTHRGSNAAGNRKTVRRIAPYARRRQIDHHHYP